MGRLTRHHHSQYQRLKGLNEEKQGRRSAIACHSHPDHCPSFVAAERMKSGHWEISITETGQAHTKTHCDLPKQVKGANGTPEEARASLEKSATTLHCAIRGLKMENDTISYTYVAPEGRARSLTTGMLTSR